MPKLMPSRLASAISLVLLNTATLATAQAQTAQVFDTVVVSASGFEQDVTDAPASITVIGQQELQQKRYGNLAQALDGVEGIDIRQGTGKTGGLNISMRGLPSEYTLIMIDGRRQNTSGNATPNGFNDTATSFMPPLSAIERIEVIRGPMSTLYGSDAMGGVINIITKKVANEWSGSVTLDHTFQEDRDYGDSSNVSFYTSGPLMEDKLGLAVRGSVYDRGASDLTFDNGSTVNKRGVSPVEGRNYTIGGRLTFTPNEDHDISLDMERGRQVYNNDDCQLGTLDGKTGGSAVNGCSQEEPTQANGYKDELRFERDQLALTHSARLGFGNLDSSITHNTTETLGRTIPGGRAGQSNFKPIGSSYDGFPSIIVGNDRELKATELVIDSKLVAPVGDTHIATIGGQWQDSELKDGISTETFEQKSWALFGEDEWMLRDDLALTLGARYDHHDAFGGHISPRGYLVWNTTDNWTLKGGVSKGYKTPSLNDLHDGINGIGGQGTVINIGNPDLQPETTINTEVGAYYDSLTGLNANVTLFHTQFSDKIADGDPVSDPLCAGNAGGTCSQKVNVDKAVTQGIELAAGWQFAPDWKLSGNYTLTDSEQKSGDNQGEPLTNTPRHMVNAKLSWNTTEQLTLWLQGEYRSDRARFLSKRENLDTDQQALLDAAGDIQGYELFHLGGSYQVSDKVTLNATIYNLLDKDFTTGTFYNNGNDWASDYTQSGRSTDGVLEEGRRLWLSTNIRF
ncbi:TonB-dependent receptor [Oceanimonas sp. AH20CE76]|uniref:TonB-dependent receptor domain-containing protein n=1 Tax=Oceanimonas TaxID=129577 RepID=UPI0029353CD0|nr:TonB-dependent receptor [Oceanimonas sp. CAM02]MDV2857373.1 TonB-dependent receptor [Oceanimonas sp. CAM02]